MDGIVFGEVRGNEVFLSVEMDPPGGWVDVALDVHTGAETQRLGGALTDERTALSLP